MTEKRIYTIEELDNIPLYKLRLILRGLSGTPSNKSAREIKEEILHIQEGSYVPTPTNRGRKPKKSMQGGVAYDDDGEVDMSIPQEDPSTASRIRGVGVEYKPEKSADIYYEDGISAPVKIAFNDSDQVYTETVIASGILDILSEGYGFLRTCIYGDRRKDFYVDRQIIKDFNLKTGDYLVGYALKRAEQTTLYISEVMKINGIDAFSHVRLFDYEYGTAVYPKKSLISETEEDKTIRALDIMVPIGKGQRGLIVAPPKTGKTTLLKKLAQSIKENDRNLHVMVLLIDERPEEVNDFAESLMGCEIIASTFDKSPERHIKFAEMAIERAKRLVENGRNVVVLMDSITKLTRAYNAVLPSSGKTLSGGLEAKALTQAKKLFGAARNIKEGGSLTIIATALVDTGSKMDDIIFEEFKGSGNMEIVLSRELAQKRIFPAIDLYQSGTRKEELILTEEKLDAAYKIRKLLQEKPNATEIFLEMLKISENNDDFLRKLDGWLKSIYS